jgi:hypothetical protein
MQNLSFKTPDNFKKIVWWYSGTADHPARMHPGGTDPLLKYTYLLSSMASFGI